MNVAEEVKNFGCYDVVSLGGKPTPKHLDYLDLLEESGTERLTVDAVAEFQSRPLLYILSGEQIRNVDDSQMPNLQCLLANRGERAYLGVLKPGELDVYPINLDRSRLLNSPPKTIKKASSAAPLFFQSVVNGVFTSEGQPEEPDYVFKIINDLMTDSSERLIKTYKLEPLDVLSFLGRALFFRFLSDRKIVEASELHVVCPQAKTVGDCFGNVTNSVSTCRWLDETFNGDLLPLPPDYEGVFRQADEQTEGRLFFHLRAILEGWEQVGDGQFQYTIDWGDLDFAHIPVGVLSQVYENFSKAWDPIHTKKTSAYYTPKNIARYLVDEAFEGVTAREDAQVLDASCGAGIFLVLAFRRLVATRWEHDGKRPDTKTIQSILYDQLCGFDVNESALRLAALSLYITAIELNGTPKPPESLKFPKPLREVVLHNHKRPEEQAAKGFVLGSLRSDVSENFNSRFDMIIGNPPWTRLNRGQEKINARFTELTRRILANRGLKEIAQAYHNPDNDPDLPFLWRSTEWAKQGGIIALALPGRIFLKQSKPGIDAFHAILKGIEITGILNGSNLSDSPAVWPGMDQPFMLFFARNRLPAAETHFYFVTPHFERRVNDEGRIRIDYQSAQPVAARKAVEDSRLLKTLSIGTILDVELLHKIDDLQWPSVEEYWSNNGLYSGLGYNLSPKQVQYDASFMQKLDDFQRPPNGEFSVRASSLPKFQRSTAHRLRLVELYTPPLLIVPESPGSSSLSPKSYVVRKPTAFSKSYYGFSAHGSKEADLIIALLYLITHADLFRYHVLLTSSRMGAERRTFLKENINHFPFPEIHDMSDQQQEIAVKLSRELESGSKKPWKAINDFIFDLYRFDQYDRQVVEDTLEVASPYKEARDRANAPPKLAERKAFYAALQRMIEPSFHITRETVSVDEIEIPAEDIPTSWHFFVVSSSAASATPSRTVQKTLISRITEEANRTGCSRFIVHDKACLLVGMISQYRYWTLSRARLCAIDILNEHLDVFPMGKN
ncbi:MAG: N-6 DNA methylase [Deltaproteobacteria bacterium]|nr:N-6 DNA methylase [Deltaproteobacteria bacterium]